MFLKLTQIVTEYWGNIYKVSTLQYHLSSEQNHILELKKNLLFYQIYLHQSTIHVLISKEQIYNDFVNNKQKLKLFLKYACP